MAKKKIEELEKQAVKAFDAKTYQMPSIDLLKVPPQQDLGDIKENIEGNIKDILLGSRLGKLYCTSSRIHRGVTIKWKRS